MSAVKRAVTTAAVIAVGLSTVAMAAGLDSTTFTIAVLAAGVLVGELLELRPLERATVPLSYAVVLVLLRAASPVEFIIAISAAEMVACVLRPAPNLPARVELLGQRIVAAALALGVYHLVLMGDGARAKALVLTALALAGVAELAFDEAVFAFRSRRLDLSWHGRSAQLALVTSGMLMAVGYDGLEGQGGMGLWGPLFFSVPLLAAWYSFERLAAIRRTYTQTLRALSIVPELGGLVREGHAERVAGLALAMGRDLGLDARDLEYLEAASLLHHIGHVCLDDPSVLGRPVESSEVAHASAEMLRQAEFLAPAAELLSPDPHPFGGAERSWTSVSGQVLRVASAYDELSEGGQARLETGAIEALYSGPGYVYDPRVLAALERVLERRSVGARAG
ncbi:MAG: hypothetical protein ACXW1M_09470 [Acidimicrobiia bacterium]